jgi:hypothetical protein
VSCASGFDPFGDREEALARHARGCPECADVLRVLGKFGAVWRDEAASDEARAAFRVRRLWRARRPARAAMMSAVLFAAIGAATAWAFERLREPGRETVGPADPPPVSAVQRVAPKATPSLRAFGDEMGNTVTAAPSATPLAPPRAEVLDATELWELGLAQLDRGDRQGAERVFRRVIDAKVVEPRLRSRAMFRWAEIRLAMGDTLTPRDTLWLLVRDKDTTLGFDSALLLERCAPDERGRIWDAYLESEPGEPLRTQAIERRNGERP